MTNMHVVHTVLDLGTGTNRLLFTAGANGMQFCGFDVTASGVGNGDIGCVLVFGSDIGATSTYVNSPTPRPLVYGAGAALSTCDWYTDSEPIVESGYAEWYVPENDRSLLIRFPENWQNITLSSTDMLTLVVYNYACEGTRVLINAWIQE